MLGLTLIFRAYCRAKAINASVTCASEAGTAAVRLRQGKKSRKLYWHTPIWLAVHHTVGMKKKLCCCIGKRLKDARAAAGLTQTDVADRCQTSRQTVSNWEQGALLPTWHLYQMCLIFGVSADYLLFGIKTIPLSQGKMVAQIFRALSDDQPRQEIHTRPDGRDDTT
jgi:transcriptional regulator with XRE-family HTH domain